MEVNQELLVTIAHSQPYPLLFTTISGAHLYGFPSPDSDYDLRGIHILPTKEVIGLYSAAETIEVSEVKSGLQIDLVTHDLKKFFILLLKRNGYVLEQLYSPLIVQTTPEHKQLKAIASNCITRNHYYHYLGFAKSQWRLFTKGNIYQIKPLLYIYRVLLTGIYLMNTGRVEANLLNLNQEFSLPYIGDLVAQKCTESEKSILKETDIEHHFQEYQRLQRELEAAFGNSHLPDDSSAKLELNSLLIDTRQKLTNS
ncbi:nucleotidyltransferase domain-containing protein [Pleurocapsa sp. FMAR1]|uniref:nucleotidyltransferase domain-containing protein n=1 Tax=Pleurocapsa sp. FMAR1 TaxID=3040204 RepID=UPI0029C5FC00|nr:nucleotidyltransferase domain-containing protein [Pleurocapsa sp. FMAR1]